MRAQGIRETYNGIIASLREEGYTLREIGEHCGVSRQRIQQILSEDYPECCTYPDNLVSQCQFAKLVGCSSATLSNLRKAGLFMPKHPKFHGTLLLYDKADIPKVRVLIKARREARAAKYVEFICETCGQKFWRQKSQIHKNTTPRFCSRHCLGSFVGAHYGWGLHSPSSGQRPQRTRGVERMITIPVNPTLLRLLKDIAYTHNVLSKR